MFIERAKEPFNHDKCRAMIYIRDTYRYTGRTKGGFELHYMRRQCKHNVYKNELCKQHYKLDTL